ncbi:DEAD/DEAH box helicase [Fusobacterium necrophorum BFTR-2]|nr:SNF2-related protein [Fusobacterium necrophorum]KDE74605.1 DEAD/DEAH box helicase [Fusobacterium necrophorum BFTR-2]
MKFVPHNYQKYCIERMVDDNILGLMLDMGLGKTIITLTAIQELKYNRFEVNKVLIIAPKKVAEVTWTDEIEKWEHLHLLRPSLVLGSASKRIKALAKNADVYVINRENVVWLVEYYKNNWPFDMVVLDEWSSFKNHQSKRFKYLKMVRGKMKRVVGLTGTPTPNGLIDLWAQVYLLDQGARLEKTIGRYRERYFDPGQRNRTTIFNYEAKDGSEHAIHEKIADICISMKAEDYLQLPDVIYETVPVVLDSKAKKSYEELEKKMILELEAGEEITVASAAALSNKLQQLANGAIYGENREVFEIHDCKIERFLELIEQLNGKPALVFYNFQHDLSRIQEALTKSGLRVRLLKSPEDQKDWNEHKIDILLAHPASAAYGLNLQEGGNHVVWFGLNWSLELYQQANKRLHRQGQKYPSSYH